MPQSEPNSILLTGWQVAGWLLVILVGVVSLLPTSDVPPPFPHADKLVHLFMYGSLGAWFAASSSWRWIELFGILILYGAALEYAQEFVPGRGFDLLDIGANAMGAGAGILFIRSLWNPLQWLDRIFRTK